MIFCVEDDASIRELVVYTLQSTGFAARGLADGRELLRALDEDQPELVLLDIMLPGEDGISLLKKLKASSQLKHIPVIMLTARGTEYDKVVGLDAGADDYIAKPFGMMELISRVKAVLRRAMPQVSQLRLQVGPVELDCGRHAVLVSGVPAELTRKEFDLLLQLMQSAGSVLTRDLLLETVWGYDFGGETRTVDVHIRTLRQKLGDGGMCIETVRGVGYRFRGDA